MGITGRDLDIFIRLKEQGHIGSQSWVIEIGAQQCSNDFLRSKSKLSMIADLFEISSPCPLPEPLPSVWLNGVEVLQNEAPAASTFWKWLGLNYKSIDLDESHNSFFIDLNYDDVPNNEKGKYHIVTNFGTTEHIANQLNAFKVIHDLTAVGGVMIHNLPAQGMLNHGLINYNPKFFWMLARSNHYHWVFIDYASSNFPQGVPKDIVDHVSLYAKDFAEREKDINSQMRVSWLF